MKRGKTSWSMINSYHSNALDERFAVLLAGKERVDDGNSLLTVLVHFTQKRGHLGVK